MEFHPEPPRGSRAELRLREGAMISDDALAPVVSAQMCPAPAGRTPTPSPRCALRPPRLYRRRVLRPPFRDPATIRSGVDMNSTFRLTGRSSPRTRVDGR